MTDRIPLDDMTSDQLDQLYNQLDALRAIARGYCPACGRGDAAPTVTDWENERRRADQLARILHVVLSEFRPLPGTSIATATVDTDTLQRWQNALDGEPADA